MIVSVIGFGHVGSVVGSVLADRGCKVYGIDKNIDLITSFKKGLSPINEPGLQKLITNGLEKKKLIITDSLESISKSKMIIITVGTPLNKKYLPNLTYLKAACNEIKKLIKPGHMICVKSTVPPGTTRKIIYKILGSKKNIDLAFTPERFSEGPAIKEFKSLSIVVGGVTDRATNNVANFWNKFLNTKIIKVVNCETAEYVKIATNAWIDLNIGFANDLARLAGKLNSKIDILDVSKSSNSLKKGERYVNILLPSIGVGGSCLTKDPWFIYSMGKKKKIDLFTIKAGRKSNNIMPYFSSEIICNYLNKKKLDYKKVKIAILGFSFKSDSGDIRHTPVIPLINDLKKKGIKNICIYDPLVTEKDQIKINLKINSSSKNVINNSDCIIICAAHKNIKNLSINYLASNSKKGALILDGRRYFERNEINKIQKKGLIYKGIGR